VGRWQGNSLNRFHFLDGIFLGQWYPEGFHAKSMVLKRFTLSERVDRQAHGILKVSSHCGGASGRPGDRLGPVNCAV